MTYTKPEITVLGDATRVIQGSKNVPPEGVMINNPGPHRFELED